MATNGQASSASPATVRNASVDEASAVAHLLTEAFADDPIELWCFECDDRLRLLELEFLEATRQITPQGWLWVTDDLSGVNAWLPPGASYDDAAIDTIVGPLLMTHGGSPERMAGFWEWTEARRPTSPHWYVDLVAVASEHRRSGIGHVLLAHGLSRADESGEPSFLITARPATVPWYERHGFKVVDLAHSPDGGPEIWFMFRRPQSRQTGGRRRR